MKIKEKIIKEITDYAWNDISMNKEAIAKTTDIILSLLCSEIGKKGRKDFIGEHEMVEVPTKRVSEVWNGGYNNALEDIQEMLK